MTAPADATLETILSIAGVDPAVSIQMGLCSLDRKELRNSHPMDGMKGCEIKYRNPFVFEFGGFPDSLLKEYSSLMLEGIVTALNIKRESDPVRYTNVSKTIATLVRLTGDKMILPVYSRKRHDTTRNAVNGGAIYDVEIVLPDGEVISCIAKKFGNYPDFLRDTLSEEKLGGPLLATNEQRQIKLELKKGNTTLSERISSADKYEKFDLIYRAARKIVQDLKLAEKRKKSFERETDRAGKAYNFIVDKLKGKKQDIGKRFVIDYVESYSKDFLEHWICRLRSGLKRHIDMHILKNLNPENTPKETSEVLFNINKQTTESIARLEYILMQEFEPVMQKQKRHVINSDLNGGNILFNDVGDVDTCDRELMSIDLVQKCIYDLTARHGFSVDQELTIADLFFDNLDTGGIDRETFHEIYLKRRILEDIVMTKNIEYARNPTRAHDEDAIRFFEDSALYYFNRGLRLAKEVVGDKFVDAISDVVDQAILGINLHLVDDEAYVELEKNIDGMPELDLTRDPLENLNKIFGTEIGYVSQMSRRRDPDDFYFPRESTITKRLVKWCGLGLSMGCLVGGIHMCAVVEDHAASEENPVRTVEFMRMSKIDEYDFELTPRNIEFLESTIPNYSGFDVRSSLIEVGRINDGRLDSELDLSNQLFGTPKRLYKSIIYSIALNRVQQDEDHLGPLLVPREYVEQHVAHSDLMDSEQLIEQVINGEGPAWASAARYVRHCSLTTDGNVVDAIAQYYVGRERIQEAIARSGGTGYFDDVVDDMNDSVIVHRGYRNFLPEDKRQLIDTAIYFYLHIGGQTLGYYPDERFLF